MSKRKWYGFRVLFLTVLALAGCSPDTADSQAPTEARASAVPVGVPASQPLPVSGSAVHYSSTEIVHSQEPTETGMIQRSTAIVELDGDVTGYVLYHPVSVFDFASETLVNRGTQIFSGTVLGSDPVILHDDEFRFDVDLSTGATVGEVRFSRSGDAPHRGGWFECELAVVGTGITPEGDLTADYSGTCIRRGSLD